MKKVLLLGVCVLVLVTGAWSDSQYKYIYSWDMDVYFGHVIYPEAKHDGDDAIVLREGQTMPEVADLNLPLAPGDTIKTFGRRCEIQFDTGTIIRLDRNTELKVETILAQSLSSRDQLTNLLLLQGQIYLMYKRYVRKEIFQVITPNAALKLNHKSVAMVHAQRDGNTDVLMKEGKAYVLYGSSANSIKRETIKKSGMVTITESFKLARGPYEAVDDFEEWNKQINEDFLDLHEGKAVAPLPIQRLPKAVYYFAQKYSTLHGEWLWDRYFGYVWRPFLNGHSYPWGGWMPYTYGRWTSVQGQLFWVPGETWGWVPYHLGFWVWNKNKGWLWIPGSVFAPAWVDWACCSGYYCWRPWSYLDWYGYDWGILPQFAYSVFLDSDLDLEPLPPGYEGTPVRQVITKDQLKSKKPPFPRPKEAESTYKKVLLALQNGEEWALSLVRETPNQVVMVSPEDLNSPNIQEKIVNLASLSPESKKEFLLFKSPEDPYRLAAQAFVRNKKVDTLRKKISDLMEDLGQNEPKQANAGDDPFVLEGKNIKNIKKDQTAVPTPEVVIDPSTRKRVNIQDGAIGDKSPGRSKNIIPVESMSVKTQIRFLDWNPDMKVARRVGVSILYSSRSNEVRCPDLNMSSRHVTGSLGYEGPRVRLTARGPVTASGSREAFIGVGSATSNTSESSSSSTSSASAASAKSSGSSSKSEKIKK
jgi:hypothetical protein